MTEVTLQFNLVVSDVKMWMYALSNFPILLLHFVVLLTPFYEQGSSSFNFLEITKANAGTNIVAMMVLFAIATALCVMVFGMIVRFIRRGPSIIPLLYFIVLALDIAGISIWCLSDLSSETSDSYGAYASYATVLFAFIALMTSLNTEMDVFEPSRLYGDDAQGAEETMVWYYMIGSIFTILMVGVLGNLYNSEEIDFTNSAELINLFAMWGLLIMSGVFTMLTALNCGYRLTGKTDFNIFPLVLTSLIASSVYVSNVVQNFNDKTGSAEFIIITILLSFSALFLLFIVPSVLNTSISGGQKVGKKVGNTISSYFK